jgi:uncharacterized membrane protein
MNQSIADRLALVLKHNGPSLLDDPDSLRRLLAPAQNPPPPEVQAILAVLKSNAVQYLQKWDGHSGEKAPYPQVREHIAGSMARAGTLDAESAAWALDAWMRALMLRGDAPRLNLGLEPAAPPADTSPMDVSATASSVQASVSGQPAGQARAGDRGQAAAPARAARLTPLGEPVVEPPPRRPVAAGNGADDDDSFIPNGRGRPMGHGWRWIVEGWHIFTASPVLWIVTVLLFIIISIVTAIVPVVGQLAGIVLTPVLTAGLMIGASEVAAGRPLSIGHLFAGFQQRVGSLVGLGLLLTLFTVVVVLIVVVLIFAFGGAAMQLLMTASVDPAALTRSSLGLLFTIAAVAVLLLLPLSMAYYFAPALIALGGQGPLAAMRMSLLACLRNSLPLLVYSLALIVLAILATLPLALGWIVLLPVLIASAYASYRDIFHDD